MKHSKSCAERLIAAELWGSRTVRRISEQSLRCFSDLGSVESRYFKKLPRFDTLSSCAVLPKFTVADLIKGAVLRPKHAKSRAHRFSLDIGPLGQLIDMFQNREATDPREENRSPLSQSWADKHLDTDFEWRVGRAVILWNSELRHHVQRRGRA
ncbi:hypothetical protein B0T25DRAFT_301823 [Lasiosphaeria hispida]|uniref:Uncharacterized protein n=1 Tax=Lasiosphaeria hispida TaxID=260671 RepID=A0AAJ0H8A6_9PEZI|nr:hypothetical protein B0T25DRAFT_301823 [Lasiosphaeria hispida]